MNFKDKVILFMATGGHTGNIPFAPGTFGTFVGLLPCFFLSEINTGGALFLIIVFTIGAIWIAHRAEALLKQKDPGCIVIDEIAGLMVTLWGFPFSMLPVVSGFILFRIFDIAKPFPIRLIEKKIPGGAGIVLDDIIAGVYSHLTVRMVFYIVEMN
ncbi:phosphatidylglycerophosphatase A [Desulfococcaceae bacterium HSG7]|nr:phosphatidylglycerophosphatase A [Desulfococcaceae bacterium HSG7]